MSFRKANPETHQICRSLLQKVVRRGCVSLIPMIVNHLVEIDDLDWLKNRVRVITFEECWPLGNLINAKLEFQDIISILSTVAVSKKHKDAAGLGALAYELSKGDDSVISDIIMDHPIQLIADAIKHPDEFWNWIGKEAHDEAQLSFVESAHIAFKHGGWPWDRAFMQAAALIATRLGVPSVTRVNNYCSEKEFPFWVAIDKHTREGKVAIKAIAEKNHQNPRKIAWLFFYFASAIENDLAPSYWWKREMDWRLSKMGYSLNEARKQWDSISQDLRSALSEYELELKDHILIREEDKVIALQLSLFTPEELE